MIRFYAEKYDAREREDDEIGHGHGHGHGHGVDAVARVAMR